MRVGIYDEAQTLYGPIDKTIADAQAAARAGGAAEPLLGRRRYGVAQTRPANATNPADPAYDWELYDRTVRYANQYGVHVLFSIYGTPAWANGGLGANTRRRAATDLRNFALAAAKRYGGQFPDGQGGLLPPVKEWLAWNEPNNPLFLAPQYQGQDDPVARSTTPRSATAVYQGVHATLIAGERVGCGVTAPRGNNNPSSSRPSVSPLAFLRAVKKAGLKTFDAWAHHPYYAGPSDTPTTKPLTKKGAPPTAVTLGNLERADRSS